VPAASAARHHASVIRNAVIHLAGEQPLLADLFDRPAPGDSGLVCTNLRDMAGKRPIFVDDQKSIFLFPYGQIRFLEILPGSEGLPALDDGTASASAAGAARGRGMPAIPQPEPEPDPEAELEIDEDFLRRIREV
jgi:hypothetical protein